MCSASLRRILYTEGVRGWQLRLKHTERTAVEVMSDSGEQNYGKWESRLLPKVEVLMDLGNLQGIPLQGLAPRKIPGVPDQSPGPDLNLSLDPEEVLRGIIQGHDLGPGPIVDLVAYLTAEIIEDGIATVIL